MKIRITDLLDDYQDDRLPLDPIPETPGSVEKPEKPRKKQPRRVRQWMQLAAAILIILSISGAMALRFMGTGETGESLSGTAAEASETAPAETASAEDVDEQALESFLEGYFSTEIGGESNGIFLSVGAVLAEGTKVSLDYSISAEIDNIVSFMPQAQATLLRSDDGQFSMLSASDVTIEAYDENPFCLRATYDFSDGLNGADIPETAELSLQISAIDVETPDGISTWDGNWNMTIDLMEFGAFEDAAVQTDQSGEGLEGDAFSVTDVTLSATSLSFWIHSGANEFTLVPLGQLALAQSENPDTACYGFRLEGSETGLGMELPSDAVVTLSNSGVTDTQTLMLCTITWEEELDIDSVSGVYFTDGTTGVVAQVDVFEH